VKFNDFEIIARSRSVSVAVSSRKDLERLSVGLLQSKLPLPKLARLLGISLSSLQGDDPPGAVRMLHRTAAVGVLLIASLSYSLIEVEG
jgi:hypothetical protein